MNFLLSPAKSLDYQSAVAKEVPHTRPQFVPQSAELIQILKTKSPQQIAELMHLSDALSALNVARYAAWRPRNTPANSKPAVLAFNGDVYEGLEAKTLNEAELGWLQDHVCILSGLYGVLRPLDLMQPYRLEMGTALPTARGKNLYEFWRAQISDYLNRRLRADPSPVVVNLASQEYFKSVEPKALKAPVVECVFQENRGGQYKIISFFAKRARGLMARYAIQHQLKTPQALQAFNLDGYAFAPSVSNDDTLVFRRHLND